MAHRARPLNAYLKNAAAASHGCPSALLRRPALARFKADAKAKRAALPRAILWRDGLFA
jgi:hypothetical protein